MAKRATGRPRKPSNTAKGAPDSLGRMLRFLRELEGLETAEQLAKQFDSTPGRYRDKPVKKSVIYETEQSKHMHMWVMTRYMNWSGLPSSVIHLIQQISSHYREGSETQRVLAIEIAKGVRNICDYILEHGSNGGRIASLTSDKMDGSNTVRKAIYSCRGDDVDSKNDRLLSIIYELLNQYPLEVRKLLINHALELELNGKWPERSGGQPSNESRAEELETNWNNHLLPPNSDQMSFNFDPQK